MKIISTVALQPAAAHHNPGGRIRRGTGRPCVQVGGGNLGAGFRRMRRAADVSVPNDIANRARGLKWIQLLSAGADHVLGGPLKGSAIPITTASGIHATPIAEYTIGLDARVCASDSSRDSRADSPRVDALGRFHGERRRYSRARRSGIVGYGSIGRETARLAAAFGMKVLALKRNPSRSRRCRMESGGARRSRRKNSRAFFRTRRVRSNTARESTTYRSRSREPTTRANSSASARSPR